MVVKNTTSGRGYDLPYASNLLSDDVLRLIEALTAVDGDIVAVITSIAGKANVVHSHSIGDVIGLASALGALMPLSKTFTLAGLTDVNTTGAATGFVLKLVSGTWHAVALQQSDVAGLTTAIASINSAITAMQTTINGGTF
jgi:hypothetical protein